MRPRTWYDLVECIWAHLNWKIYVYFNLPRHGGSWCSPQWVLFLDVRRNPERIARKKWKASWAYFMHFLAKKLAGLDQVTEPWCHKLTTSDRFFHHKQVINHITCFHWLGYGDMRDWGQMIATSDLWLCILTIRRTSEATDLDQLHTYLHTMYTYR